MFAVTGAEWQREGGRALKHAVEAVAVGRGRQVVRGRTFYRLSTWELKQSGEAAPARLAYRQAGRRQAAGRDRCPLMSVAANASVTDGPPRLPRGPWPSVRPSIHRKLSFHPSSCRFPDRNCRRADVDLSSRLFGCSVFEAPSFLPFLLPSPSFHLRQSRHIMS